MTEAKVPSIYWVASVILALVTLLIGLVIGNMFTRPNPMSGQAAGNGAPSGGHYSLNIIGVPKGKTADMTGNMGHRIFVALGTKEGSSVSTKIMLSQSTNGTFQVLDANGTDGTATFQLPAPGTYTVWARALGKPGGRAVMTTCAESAGLDGVFGTADDEEVCSTANEIFARQSGGSKFRNVTTALTTIQLDESLTDVITACGGTTVSLFDPCLQGYFWDYANNGLKLLQVRFYPTT